MKRIVLSLILLCSLVSFPAAANKSLSDIMRSVVYLDGEAGHCTAFAVSVRQFLTAKHCIDSMGKLSINNEESVVITIDHKHDLALISGPIIAPLEMASREPELGDEVVLIGWPRDWADQKPLLFFGRVAALKIAMKVDDNQKHEMNFFHEGGGGGMSGGPIVNTHGQVVGLIQASATYPSVSVAGATVESIRKFLRLK